METIKKIVEVGGIVFGLLALGLATGAFFVISRVVIILVFTPIFIVLFCALVWSIITWSIK